MAVSHLVSDLQDTQNRVIKHTNNVSSLEERSRILKGNLVPDTRDRHLILKPRHTVKQHKDIPGSAIIRPPAIDDFLIHGYLLAKKPPTGETQRQMMTTTPKSMSLVHNGN